METHSTAAELAQQLCPHVPLSAYSWSGVPTPSAPYCSRLALNTAVYYLIIASHVSAYWLTGILSYKVVSRFTRWNSVYFWSLQWTAWSIILHCVAEDVYLFSTSNDTVARYAHLVLIAVSQPGTTSGYGLILWSRLHLICHDKKVLRFFLAAILLTWLPVSVCKITGYSLVHSKGGSPELGQQLLDVGSYLLPTTVLTEVAIMTTYLQRLYRFAQPEPLKDPATLRLMGFLIASMGYVVIFSAACISAMLAGLTTAHSIVPVGFALKLWVEYGVLIQIVKFSSREQRDINHLTPTASLTYNEGTAEITPQSSPRSEEAKGPGFVVW